MRCKVWEHLLFLILQRLLPVVQDEIMFTIMLAGLSTEVTLEVKLFFLKSSFFLGDIFVHIIALKDIAG